MKWMRKLLFPFAAIYFLVTLSRNWLYTRKLFSSTAYPFPVICVGNLNTGGTGKSPMTEYLIRLFYERYQTIVLSRGYGRKTKGYLEVTADKRANQVGDEPLQFAKKFSKTRVMVCEDRRAGIIQITQKYGVPDVLILDDAYQHRGVEAGYYILLTTYGDLFVDDYMLPVGNLREPRKGANRADAIVVTKCPSELSVGQQQKLRQRLGAQSNQEVFFTTIKYSKWVEGKERLILANLKESKIKVVTGIANPLPFIAHLKNEGLRFEHDSFGDHHNFTANEIEQLDIEGIVLTTEKDFVRLEGKFKKARLYYLPIETQFIDNASLFNEEVMGFVAHFN